MRQINRRSFIQRGGVAAATVAGLGHAANRVWGEDNSANRFTMDLRCSSIGVNVDQPEAIKLAADFGFESVTPRPDFLADLSDDAASQLVDQMRAQGLGWGAAGLPVEFRRDEGVFTDGLKQLPRLAAGLQRHSVTRVGTWLSPSHQELTYLENFRQHAARLRQCAEILADHGLRLGLEYVGPKTLWASSRHSFVHTMAETKELIDEISGDNVGLVLDSWHWYTAHETEEDLRSLSNHDVVACDLNDAPVGLARDEQIDNRRELPSATGVIDLKTFLSVLIDIGYDGPIRAEPFNRQLNERDDRAAVGDTAIAMRKAFALVEINVP